MKFRVLITCPEMRIQMPKYHHLLDPDRFDVTIHHTEQRVEEADLCKLIMGYDGVISGDDEFTRKVLMHSNRLKVISKWGVGVDSVDLQAAEEMGIQVYWSPGTLTDPVADTAMGYILMFALRLHELDAIVRTGTWVKLAKSALRTKTLGVIGVGNIGKALARRAKPFKMRLLGNDIISITEDVLWETGISMVDLDVLLSESDFICICVDLNETSHHLIDLVAFEKMKKTVFLINVARGKVVDERALIFTLHASKIAGAALDVFETEPLPPDSPLLKMNNVILGTHNAYNEDDAVDEVTRSTIRNLIRGLTGN